MVLDQTTRKKKSRHFFFFLKRKFREKIPTPGQVKLFPREDVLRARSKYEIRVGMSKTNWEQNIVCATDITLNEKFGAATLIPCAGYGENLIYVKVRIINILLGYTLSIASI
jgi:hypothetical protein